MGYQAGIFQMEILVKLWKVQAGCGGQVLSIAAGRPYRVNNCSRLRARCEDFVWLLPLSLHVPPHQTAYHSSTTPTELQNSPGDFLVNFETLLEIAMRQILTIFL